MALKDNPPSGSKDALLKDLKSLKNTLDEDDDNVPLLLEEDDIPVLGDDDNIPVLDSPELSDAVVADKASLEAALRQLESMELAPRSRKTPPARQGIEETIRANAAPPIISHEELTRVRENPFLNSNQKAQLDASRKLREEAQQAARAAASGQKTGAPQKTTTPAPQEEVIEFTDNPFLKASSSPVGTQAIPAASAHTPVAEEDGSAEILKELGEDARPYQPLSPQVISHQTKAAAKAPVIEKPLANTDQEAEGLGDIILEDEEPAAAPKVVVTTSVRKKIPEKEIDPLIDEIVEEYIMILEAALRKKLKEKLPDLLK